MTFEISFRDLWTYRPADPRQRLPLSALPEDGEAHIHGWLEIRVAGRALPHLGYFGPDDVCFNDWTQELLAAAARLSSADPSEHVHDEGEQGQPAFSFRRIGSSVFVSIVASELSGQNGDPAWQQVECLLADFLSSVRKFREIIEKAILSLSPIGGRKWVEWVMNQKA